MSLLGKILLFVNLLAGGGFVYLALQDWKGRQTIEAGGLKHILLLSGLPLGGGKDDPPDALPNDPEAEIKFRVEVAGGYYTETVGPLFLKSYFANAPGSAPTENAATFAGNMPVATQLAEVKRVQGIIKGSLDKADGGTKATLAYAWLEFQVETYDERLQLQVLRSAGNGDELAGRLMARFDQVLKAPAPPSAADLDAIAAPKDEGEAPEKSQLRLAKAAEVRAAAVKDENERRVRLAHLLVHLDRDPAWQKRVLMVVGLRRYVRVIADQAVRFHDMAARVERLTLDDQDKFAAEYAQLRGIAIERTQMVREIAEVRARLEEQRQKDADFVAQRKTQLAQLTAQLQKMKAEVDALIAQQHVLEQQLFAVEREVALTLEDIYRLQDELIRREREKYAGKK